MSIIQRNGVWHCHFFTPSGQRVRKSLGTRDKRQAQELYDKLKAEAWRVNKLGEAPTKYFQEACVRWLQEKVDKRSLDSDRSKISFFLLHFKDVPLNEITNDRIQSALSSMENRSHRARWERMRDRLTREGKVIPHYRPKPVSQSTIYSHQAFMRSLLRIAAREWGWLDNMPAVKAKAPRTRRIRWLTKDEARSLIRELPEYFRPLVIFALATGLRRSNIINMEWQQIDMQRKMAWIPPEDAKGGRAIGVSLNETACQVLRDQIGKHHRWVFVQTESCFRPDGTECPKIRKFRNDSNKAWRSALRRAGIENFRFHDLRHTWASWLVQEGVPLSALQEMGGWESVDMVRKYAHLSNNHLSQHAKVIDDIFHINDTKTTQPTKKALRH
ncbi:integrase [Edwardsiella phage Edno5]|uniref:Integrase n=1 Tax=Edwardsiella phage Edno5 TaxID=2419942 RepID=A0A3G3BY95_9CAUD|nr:integrase [Edwardsiella phage Edno5]AYP69185.1 integrase [Edwardsiella phage Edno5]RFT05476.1 integrase [Edwardsiella anguillarum]